MKQTKRKRLVEGSDRNTGFKKLGWENLPWVQRCYHLPYTAIHAIAKLDLKILTYDSKKEIKIAVLFTAYHMQHIIL